MKDDTKLTRMETLKLWARRNLPFLNMSELAEAIADVKVIGPMDWYREGMPSYWPQYALLCAGYLFMSIMYFVNDACMRGTYVMSEVLLGQLNFASFAMAIVGTLALMYVLIDSHRGTFDHYEIQIEPWNIYDLKTREKIESIMRVRKSWDAWPPEGWLPEETEAVRKEIRLANGIEKNAGKDGLELLQEAMDE